MRNRLSRRLALAAVSAVLALSSIGVASTAAGGSTISGAACSVGGNSTFTVSRTGWYAWTWREGTTVLGYGAEYLTTGTTKTVDTPDGAVASSSKFGVVGGKSYAYPTCGV